MNALWVVRVPWVGVIKLETGTYQMSTFKHLSIYNIRILGNALAIKLDIDARNMKPATSFYANGK